MSTTRRVGLVLLLSGVVLALAVIPLWSSATREADQDALADEYRAAIIGGPVDEPAADRTLPIAVGAVGGVLFLAGVILLAVPRPSDGS